MTILPNLHDGFFDGVWLSADKCARFFVRTAAGELSTIILTDVQALNICDLRAGNIIFDLVLIAPDKMTVKDIEQAYDLQSGDVDKAQQLLGKAQEQGLSGLEINASYGAEGITLFRAAATVAGHVLD